MCVFFSSNLFAKAEVKSVTTIECKVHEDSKIKFEDIPNEYKTKVFVDHIPGIHEFSTEATPTLFRAVNSTGTGLILCDKLSDDISSKCFVSGGGLQLGATLGKLNVFDMAYLWLPIDYSVILFKCDLSELK